MKVLYNASDKGAIPIPISTGGGFQFVLVWFEDQGDWFVYFADTNTSQAYIHRIVNKFATSSESLFSGLNMETLSEEQFITYTKWIDDNFNYQGLHKDEKLDEISLGL